MRSRYRKVGGYHVCYQALLEHKPKFIFEKPPYVYDDSNLTELFEPVAASMSSEDIFECKLSSDITVSYTDKNYLLCVARCQRSREDWFYDPDPEWLRKITRTNVFVDAVVWKTFVDALGGYDSCGLKEEAPRVYIKLVT